jgi:hypothetical protein
MKSTMKPIHVVVGVFQGCADSVQLFTDKVKTEEAKAKPKKELGIQEGHEEESNNKVVVFFNVPVK